MAKNNEPREPKKGDKINLILASGQPTPAQITGVNKDGTVDLEAGEIVITRSPRDDSRKLSDSWHFLADEPKVEKSEETKTEGTKTEEKKDGDRK